MWYVKAEDLATVVAEWDGFILTMWYVKKAEIFIPVDEMQSFILTKWYVNINKGRIGKIIVLKFYIN